MLKGLTRRTNRKWVHSSDVVEVSPLVAPPVTLDVGVVFSEVDAYT